MTAHEDREKATDGAENNNTDAPLTLDSVLGADDSSHKAAQPEDDRTASDSTDGAAGGFGTRAKVYADPVEEEKVEQPADDSSVETDSDSDSSDEEDEGPNFSSLGLPDAVLHAVEKVGFESPSAIQAETIPVLMEGHDVVGLAQTGTGKTAAFALPVLAGIDPSVKAPQALVLAPTRELALQVADAFQSFADHLPGRVNVLPIYGGQAYGIQLSGLRRGAQIIVGTPGRVIDHLNKGSLDISDLRFMVLDEADEMLNMGFQEDVERILADTPADKQVALFSATMPNGIRRLSKQYLSDPVEITVKSKTRTATNIRQRYLHVAHRNKLDAMTRILEVTEFEGMIVFVRTKHETEELAEKLRARGFTAAAINGDIPQNVRERTVDQLKDGRLDILVATDVAARGLDVERISLVLNFDIPSDTESYVHRIGRTGRAGRSGEAILFITPRERRMLGSIERATGARLEEMDLPTVDEVNESRKEKFAASITEALENPEVALFRTLVKTYSEENDVPLEDIAAALAVKSQADDDSSFFMTEPSRHDRRGRDRDFGDRGGRRDDRRDDRRGGRDRGTDDYVPDPDKTVYRLAVGRRQHVRPGAIVGALANEGGLNSKDFGRIVINVDHTFVELPKNMGPEVFDNLAETRISGQLINIEADPDADMTRKDDGGFGGGRGGGFRRGGFRGGNRDRGGYNRGGGNRRGGGGWRDRDGDDRGGNRRGGGGWRDRDGDDRRGGGWRGRDDRGGQRGGGFRSRGGWRD